MKWLSSVLAAGLVACGGIANDADGGADAAPDGALGNDGGGTKDAAVVLDASPPVDAGDICNGTGPRMTINGSEVAVASATGKSIILNCCDSAELTVASGAFQALMNVLWRAPATGSGSIDLASPPQPFSIEMDLGCDPATTSCATASPEERYTDGFTGTIQYGLTSAGMTASYCIHVAESASQPHALIHSMTLYAPDVVSQ